MKKLGEEGHTHRIDLVDHHDETTVVARFVCLYQVPAKIAAFILSPEEWGITDYSGLTSERGRGSVDCGTIVLRPSSKASFARHRRSCQSLTTRSSGSRSGDSPLLSCTDISTPFSVSHARTLTASYGPGETTFMSVHPTADLSPSCQSRSAGCRVRVRETRNPRSSRMRCHEQTRGDGVLEDPVDLCSPVGDSERTRCRRWSRFLRWVRLRTQHQPASPR